MSDFVKTLSDSNAYLFDGAMGSMLYSRGHFVNRCYEELNLKAGDAVLEIHREYVAAGVDILETNTYGANRVKLSEFGLSEKLRDINARGVELARKAARSDCWVAGAIGPLGIRLEPYGPTSLQEAEEIFAEQVAILVEAGADLILLETFASLIEIRAAIRAVRSATSLPVISQMTLGPDLKTVYGDSVETVARGMDQEGADVIGLNCTVGPDLMLDAVERVTAVTTKKISCLPNAGLPREVHGRRIYMASPDYMGRYASRLVQKGVKFLGGCCGTTPDHLKVMVEAVRPLSPKRSPVEITEVDLGENAIEPVALRERSRWGQRLADGQFVTTVEIVPPKGPDPSKLMEKIREIRDHGVHAVNVPDGPRAQNRMGAIATAVLIEREGIEAVLHYCCRDRNLLGMHSDLLGCAALGVRNMLLITGDPPKMGPYPDATAVFDIDSIGLTNMVSLMNQGLDLGGNPFGEQTKFVIGVGVNPGHVDFDYEMGRFDWKVQAGAEYAITQPVFDVKQLEHFLTRVEHHRVPIVAGIWPLLSYRNATFMNNEVPGVSVPDQIIERMRVASEKSREHAFHEGTAIARETLERVRERVAGVQVSAPLGRVDLALEVFGGMLDTAGTA